MTNPRPSVLVPACFLAGLTAIAGPAGCGSGAADQPAVATAPPPRPVAPPKPRKPPVVAVAQLMTELGIDDRVNLPEERAPGTTAGRRAVLEFFDGFARGDDTAVGTMLSALDGDELESLVDTGAWAETTSQIIQIDVQTGQSPDGQECALAIFYVGDDFQPQLWYYTVDDAGPRFDAVASPPDLVERISGTDWIAGWFEILDKELAMADQPDEEFIVPKKHYTDTANKGGYSGPIVDPGKRPSGPQNPNKPSAPPGLPGKRPKKSPRPAPGKGLFP